MSYDPREFKEFATKEGLIPEQELIARMAKDFGPPAFKNQNKELSRLNEAFWAGLRAAETYTIHSPEERAFYRYNDLNGLHEHLTDSSVLVDFDRRVFRAAAKWGGEWLGRSNLRSARTLEAIMKHFKGQTECKDAFRSPQHWQPVIACKNCLVRVDKESLQVIIEPFSPRYRLRHASPFAYDKNASCPEFEKRLLGHLENEDKKLPQKLGGQCLLGRNLSQRIVILDGVGSSSKSAFIAILRGILGPQACAELRTALLSERFEIGAVARANLLCGSDVPGDFLSRRGANRLKALVGDDLLECEHKNSNLRYWITGLLNVFISSNTTLHVRLSGDYSAWRRRLLRIHYDKPFIGNRILKLDEILLAKEGPGIFNFFLNGAVEFLRDVQETGDIKVADKHQALVDTLLG